MKKGHYRYTVCVFDRDLNQNAVHHVTARDAREAAKPWEDEDCDYISVFRGHLLDLHVPKPELTMQDLLDHVRSPAAVYNPIPNPWKWDGENEKWTALDEYGGMWESEEDEITAVQVGWL